MVICDVVISNVWNDPRVRKQLIEYKKTGNYVKAIGFSDERRNDEEIKKLCNECFLVSIPAKYYRDDRTVLTKIAREYIFEKQLYEAIKKCQPDIVHANDLNALIPSYFAAKSCGAQLIYDSHEIFIENDGMYNRRWLKRIYRCLESYMIRRCDQVVCVSNAAANYLSNYYNIKCPMVVTNSVREADIVEKPKKRSVDEEFEVLIHGRFTVGRGYDILLNAAEQCDHPNIKFVIRGYGELEEKIMQQMKEHSVTNFRIDDPVSVASLVDMASRSHVGVAITEPICLNYKLSISNKIFEYAAAGLPVIMSNIPEHRYLNEKYKIGMVLKNNSPKELLNAVFELYDNVDFYNKCAKNALYMAQELSWEQEFQKLMEAEKIINA